MASLNIISSTESDTFLISIEGSIDESFLQKSPQIPAGKKVIIDFEKVRAINSLGIRHWIQWMRTYGQSTFVFQHCPQCVIEQINAVSDFIPPKCTIESFYVPYYNEASGEEQKTLYKINEDYSQGNPPTLKKILDSTGAEMEIDVYPSKYFRFLQQKSS